jgi:DNA-binding transcriptional regulator LsrR (DeoR family)
LCTMTKEQIEKYLANKATAKEFYYQSNLSANQIAKMLRLSQTTILRMIDDNDPKAVRKAVDKAK